MTPREALLRYKLGTIDHSDVVRWAWERIEDSRPAERAIAESLTALDAASPDDHVERLLLALIPNADPSLGDELVLANDARSLLAGQLGLEDFRTRVGRADSNWRGERPPWLLELWNLCDTWYAADEAPRLGERPDLLEAVQRLASKLDAS